VSSRNHLLRSFVVAALAATPLVSSAQEAPRRPLKYITPVVAGNDSMVYFIADAPNLATPGSPNPDNLYCVKTDGTGLKRLTHNGASTPRWRRGVDGYITFAGTASDSGNVFAVRPDGTGLRLLAAVPGRNPVLSPDGTKVAYIVGPQQEAELWVLDMVASDRRRIAGGAGSAAWFPAWDPDGRRLAYTYGAPQHGQAIHVVRVEGAVRDTAVTNPSDQRYSMQRPAWSPDGRRIAVQWSEESGRGSRIAIIDLPTRGIRILDVPPPRGLDTVRDECPWWFPDGKRLVFHSDRSGNSDIWSINDDGSGLTQITGIR
jgi:Tol biopolymer transport system component